jgi:tetratricopeptide (TPR) repeat protein
MAAKSGRLEPLKLFKVFRSLLERQMSGVLTLRRGQVVKQAQIVSGHPLRTASNLQSESLLWALVEQALISSTEKLQVEAQAAAERAHPEQLVLSLGLVAEARLRTVERQLHRQRLIETFGWPDGTFTFEARPLRVEPNTQPIDGTELLVEAGARALPDAVCERFIQRFGGQFVCPTPWVEKHGAFFNRFFPEPNLLRLLVGPIQYPDLARAAGPDNHPARQVFALIVSGLAAFQSAAHAEQIRRELSRAPGAAVPPPAPPPPPNRVAAKLRTPPTPVPLRGTPAHGMRAMQTSQQPAKRAPVSGAHAQFESSGAPAMRAPVSGGHARFDTGQANSGAPGRASSRRPGAVDPITGGHRAHPGDTSERQLRTPATPARGMHAADPGGSWERPIPRPGQSTEFRMPAPPARSGERGPGHGSIERPRAPTPAKGMRAVDLGAPHAGRQPAASNPPASHRPMTPAKGMRAVNVNAPEPQPRRTPNHSQRAAGPGSSVERAASSDGAPRVAMRGSRRRSDQPANAAPSRTEATSAGSAVSVRRTPAPQTGRPASARPASARPGHSRPVSGRPSNAQAASRSAAPVGRAAATPKRPRTAPSRSPSAQPASQANRSASARGQGNATPKPAAQRAHNAEPMPPKIQGRLEAAKALFERIEESSHYEILGLQQAASNTAIRAAFRGLARTFHVDGYARYDLSDADRRVVQQVFIAVNRASEILGDVEKRREYDLGLARGHKQGTPAGGGVQIDQVFKAERLVREAVSLIRNGKAPSAVVRLEEALQFTPDDPLALAAKLYADNLVVQARGSAPQVAVRTRDKLAELLDDYSARDEPFVYLGRLNKALGQRARAVAAFRKALEINPRCGEAGSELRHLQRDADAKSKGGGLFGRRKKSR